MKSVAAAAASAVLLSSAASAAELGKLTVLSALGQPLRAEIELNKAAGEDLSSIVVKLASFDAYQLANIELTPALQSLRFSVEERGKRRFVRIQSAQPISEPALNLLVEMTSNQGRATREYTFVLDPRERRKTQPAQAAGRTAGARAADAASSNTGTYRVREGDTLSGIASRIRPNQVSLDMMLVALYRANPEAFIGNNMNRLKSGRVLSVPSADAVRSSVTQAEARDVVVAHAVDFHAYRNKLAGQVATSKPVAKAPAGQSARGRVTARVQEKPTAANAAQDQLRLSKATPGKAGKAAEGTSNVDAVAREKAVTQAEARVRELEKNVSELESLMAIKSPAGAAAEQTARNKGKAASDGAKTPAAGKAAGAADAAKPETAPAAGAPAKPEGDVAAGQAGKPAEGAAPAPAETSLAGKIRDNAVALGAGAAVILLGLLAWARRRQQQGEAETPGAAGAEPTLLGAAGAEREPSLFGDQADAAQGTDHGPFNANLAAGSADADPIAEADVFIAYGREAQAEQVLKDALAVDPERHSVRLKLLDMYVGRKDLQAFEAEAREMHRLTEGKGEAWAQAAALGLGLDPLNPLYADAPAAATAESMAESIDAGAAPVATSLEKNDGAVSADDELDFDLGTLPAQPAAQEVAVEEVALDAGGPRVATPGVATPGLDAPRADFSQAPVPQQQYQASPVDMAGLAKDFEGLPPLPAGTPQVPPAKAAEPAFDLDALDLDDAPAQAPASTTDDAPVLDLSAFDLELAKADAADAAAGAPAAGAPAAEDGEQLSAEYMEMETKLDLAMAYQEIGDKEGARELLDEVIKGGNSAQAGKARAMRERLL